MTIVGTLEGLAPPEEWTERALCAQVDPDIFHVDKGESSKPAKKICSNCPVIEECLEYALRTDQRFGVFGGYSERERRKLRGGQMVKRTFGKRAWWRVSGVRVSSVGGQHRSSTAPPCARKLHAGIL